MNLNKDLESWACVEPEIVLSGSKAQGVNVMKMALEDIQSLGRELFELREVVRNMTSRGSAAISGF